MEIIRARNVKLLLRLTGVREMVPDLLDVLLALRYASAFVLAANLHAPHL